MGGLGDWSMMSKGCRVFFRGDENFLKLILVMDAQLCEHTKSHWIVHKMGELYGMEVISQ